MFNMGGGKKAVAGLYISRWLINRRHQIQNNSINSIDKMEKSRFFICNTPTNRNLFIRITVAQQNDCQIHSNIFDI